MGKYKIYLHCTGKVQDIYYLYRESTEYITNCTGKVAGYIQIVQEKYWKYKIVQGRYRIYKNCTGKTQDLLTIYRESTVYINTVLDWESTGYINIVHEKYRIY